MTVLATPASKPMSRVDLRDGSAHTRGSKRVNKPAAANAPSASRPRSLKDARVSAWNLPQQGDQEQCHDGERRPVA